MLTSAPTDEQARPGEGIVILRANATAIPLADASVHCVVTSPPYWALRDYGHAGDEWPVITYRTIGGEVSVPAMRCPLGLEPTPDAFIGHMLIVFREVRRVLRDDGTCWCNIGDSYSASRTGGDPARSAVQGGNSNQAAANTVGIDRSKAGLKAKDLVGIPWMLAFALRADGWYLRQDVIWHKPNPMPESTRDRCTKAHEYVFLLTKSPRYYFDQDAIRTPSSPTNDRGNRRSFRGGGAYVNNQSFDNHASVPNERHGNTGQATGANKRSVWRISTESCTEAHFATFPTKLVEPCILAGTSAKGVCPACGAQWRRVVDKARVPTRPGDGSKVCGRNSRALVSRDIAHAHEWEGKGGLDVGNRDPRRHVVVVTGETWVPGCKCREHHVRSTTSRRIERHTWYRAHWRSRLNARFATVPAIVFDPFSGAGTTAIVAARHGRRFVGTELSSDYIAISVRRIDNDKPKRVKAARARSAAPAPIPFPDLFSELTKAAS